MGFRYQKRVNLGEGLGINISKSGISSSYRSKYGSIGSRGFSIRTGISGLSFRNNWGSSKNKDSALIYLSILLTAGVLYLAVLVIWNVIVFLIWVVSKLYYLILQAYHKSLNKKQKQINISEP